MDAPPRFKTREQDRIGFGEKLSLGIGNLPIFYGYAAIGSIAVPYFQMTLNVDPAWIGTAIALPRLWDAFTDPAMGFISDNTHSRWGRRRPYIVLGALLMAATFGAIWMAPPTWGERALSIYVTVALLVFYTCYTIYSVPWTSLSYEMTPDPRERTRVASYSGFFGKVGELTYSWFFPLSQAAIFASATQGVRVVGWVVAFFLFAVVGVIPGLLVRERYFKRAAAQERVRVGRSVQAAFASRAFVVLVGLTILQILAGMFASNVDYYLIVYSMCGGDVAEGSHWKAVLSTAYALVGIIAIYPLNRLANHFSKRVTLSFAFVLVLVGAAGKWILFTPGNNWKLVFDAVLCGPVWIAINILTISMLADICDEDELRHGLRREGVFGAIFEWVKKTGYSFGFLGAFLVVRLTGFDSKLGGDQSPESILALRVVLAGSTAVWAVAAIGVLRYYPITDEVAYATRDQLEARRGRIT
jgi:GPH family glycoside/pentoside/hexuronide:cation symporter